MARTDVRLRGRLPTTFVIGMCVLCSATGAQAGPPLISDDPNTVGAGVALPILATSAFHRAGGTLLRGPILDLTVGLVESLDITFIASLENRYTRAEDCASWSSSGLFLPGLKWRFVGTEKARAAFSPAFGIDTQSPRRPFFLLPVQAEFAVGALPWVLGFDLGYVPVIDDPDRWFVAPYVRAALNPGLSLLMELWMLGSGPGDAIDFGASFGLNAGIAETRLRFLAALGPGVVSLGRDRVAVRAYLGVQYTFRP